MCQKKGRKKKRWKSRQLFWPSPSRLRVAWGGEEKDHLGWVTLPPVLGPIKGVQQIWSLINVCFANKGDTGRERAPNTLRKKEREAPNSLQLPQVEGEDWWGQSTALLPPIDNISISCEELQLTLNTEVEEIDFCYMLEPLTLILPPGRAPFPRRNVILKGYQGSQTQILWASDMWHRIKTAVILCPLCTWLYCSPLRKVPTKWIRGCHLFRSKKAEVLIPKGKKTEYMALLHPKIRDLYA